MTQEITAEQALRIFDLESYKAVTGFQRFKRTKEEMALDISPEEALKRRLAAFQATPPFQTLVDANKRAQEQVKKVFTASAGSGEIVIRIRPAKGVDKDYLERLPKTEIVLEQDNFFYGRMDDKLAGLYDGETQQFFTDLIEGGMGELIDHPKFKEAHVNEDAIDSTAN
jgi:hypothetical protein